MLRLLCQMCVGRDHNYRRLRIHLQKLFECAESADTRHGDVKEYYIESAMLRKLRNLPHRFLEG